MARRKVLRHGGDVREHPQYSIEDVSRFLHIPLSTMKAWCQGQSYTLKKSGVQREFHPLITPADPDRGLLSFYNLAEAHVLRFTRDKDIPLKNLRKALDYIREKIPTSKYPLLSHEFSTYGKSVFIHHLGETINATKYGQIAMADLLDKYLERIERDDFGMPIQVYPINSTVLAINPLVASGKPVVKGTRVMASVLAERKRAGESYGDLVKDYGLTESQIEQAITEYAA
jgi:uncharacterized protein (DUF433 family)